MDLFENKWFFIWGSVAVLVLAFLLGLVVGWLEWPVPAGPYKPIAISRLDVNKGCILWQK